MSGAAVHPGPALAAMLLVQTLTALALSSASVLAPAVAPTLGIAPGRIGLYAAVGFLCAMLSGLRSGHWVARLGAMRVSQGALIAAALGAALAALGPAGGLLFTALLVGSGYGVVNPSSAAVLAHHSPVGARSLFFSIKQTGVPIGVALAGVLMPLGLSTVGWRLTVAALALVCLAAAAVLVPLVRKLEPPPSSQAAPPALASLRAVWRSPPLRRLSLASLAFSLTQQCFVTFLVSLLNLELGWSLAAAAGVLSLSQAVSTGARIVFGAIADRWVSPGRLLGLLGLAMAAGCLGLFLLGPSTRPLWTVIAALVCSATAMGWNGVFLADLSLHADRHALASISGAAQFFTFGGGMIGPLVFGEFVRAGAGSYGLAYALVAVLPAAVGTRMVLAARRPSLAASR